MTGPTSGAIPWTAPSPRHKERSSLRPKVSPGWNPKPRNFGRLLQQARDGTADRAEVLTAAGERAPELLDAEALLERHDPRLSRRKRADVHARGLLRDLPVRDDAQHGGVLLGVAPLQFERLRDLLPAQRAAGAAFGFALEPAGRRGAEGVLFLGPGLVCSTATGLAFAVAPER